MTDLLADIADTADELTNPRQNVERIQTADPHRNRRTRRIWVVTLPSLLDQLAQAIHPGETYVEAETDTSHGSFESRPAARIDAIDRLLAIEAGAATWCQRTRQPLREHPASNIRALVGTAPTIGSDQQTGLLRDLRAWRTWAATVTGWERPADAPRGACPACGKRNTLRVRLARQTGCCMACGAWWDHASIGILADHLRAAAETAPDTRALRSAAVATRRAEEAHRIALSPTRRPDLPYAEDLTDVRI